MTIKQFELVFLKIDLPLQDGLWTNSKIMLENITITHIFLFVIVETLRNLYISYDRDFKVYI